MPMIPTVTAIAKAAEIPTVARLEVDGLLSTIEGDL